MEEAATGFEQLLDGFDCAPSIDIMPGNETPSDNSSSTAEADIRSNESDIDGKSISKSGRRMSEGSAYDVVGFSRLEVVSYLPVMTRIAGAASQSPAKAAGKERSQNQEVEAPVMAPCAAEEAEEEVDALAAFSPSGLLDTSASSSVVGGFDSSLRSSALTRGEDIGAQLCSRIHVTELVTHLPTLLANMLPANFGASPEVSIEPDMGNGRLVPNEQPLAISTGPAKVVRFQVEPEALGELSVTMRVSSARVQIEIDAQTASVAGLLRHSRDMLTTAIEHRGLALESFDVTNRSAILPSISAPEQAMRDQMAGGHGFGGGGKFGENTGSDNRRRSASREREARMENSLPAHGVPGGVVL